MHFREMFEEGVFEGRVRFCRYLVVLFRRSFPETIL